MIILLICATSISTTIRSTQESISETAQFRPNELLVSFKPEVATAVQVRAALDSVQGEVITFRKRQIEAAEWDLSILEDRSFRSSPHLLHVKLPEGMDIERAMLIFGSNPIVEYVEKNFLVHASYIPNDPHWSKLWGLYEDSQSRSDIHAPEAWDIITGSPDVVVAVIDTGIDYDHPDLEDNIWLNPGECGNGKETNGIDDDGNGYEDDWHGWDFVNGDNNPMDGNTDQEGYHGTHVAGIIGAVGDNDIGMAGVTWDVQLMPLRVLGEDGVGDTADIINAVDYATDNGANISNNSYGGAGYSTSFLYAIGRALSAGSLFIAAAGNNSTDNDTTPHYPSSYNLNNIVSVLATDIDDELSGFSNYGSTSVDIGAPGGTDTSQSSYNIYGTKYGQAYQYHAGTSQATPFVTGAAALAWQKRPEMTYSQLKTRIMDKADYDSDLNGKCVADGRLNAYSVLYDSAVPNGTPDSLNGTWYSWKSISVNWGDNSSNEIGFDVQRKKPGESEYTSIHSADANFTYHTDITVAGGTVYYQIRAYNMAGYSSLSSPLSVTVPAGVPSGPSDLTAEDPTLVHHVVLSWQDNATNEQAFVIQRRLSGGGSWTTVATIDVDPYSQYPTMSWTDTGVNQGNYYYRVKATNPNGSSSYSNELYVEVEGY